MHRHWLFVLSAVCAGLTGPATADPGITGQASTFTSWFGVEERCVRITPMPGATYSDADIAGETALCALDLYNTNIAICPKIWSTSPSVVLYDLIGSRLQDDRRKFQEDICSGGKAARYVASAELARLKFTMNQRGTSAAYAASPILYYHLSRYLGLGVEVAPAVWRSMDKQVLLGEVALGGALFTNTSSSTQKIHKAWQTIVDAIRDPASYDREGTYGSSADLLLDDGLSAYGTLLNATGSGFGAEVNGVDEDTPNDIARMRQFIRTPGYIALMIDAPLDEAIRIGMERAYPPVAETMPDGLSGVQVAYWARDLAETTLLDYILSQKDRPGNIDRRAYLAWGADGAVRWALADGAVPGDGTVPEHALPIGRLVLNDNDAAAKLEYQNDALQSGMIARLRHFDPATYGRLQALAADVAAEGPAWDWLTDSAGITWNEAAKIRQNIIFAAETLAQSCELGLLRFDLDPDAYLLGIAARVPEVVCRP